MPADFESAADEAAHLRGCLNDLVGVLTLPALWTGNEPLRIATTLADALREMLDVAFVFVRLNDAEGGTAVEIVRSDESLRGTGMRDIGSTLAASFGAAPAAWPPRARACLDGIDLSVGLARLGLDGEIGVVAAGAARGDFPRQTERLLLDVAANQAVLGLQQARLLAEETQRRSELDARVALRTGELAAANERLRNEVAQRRRVEDALKRSERDLTLIVDTIPALAWSARPDGSVEYFNRHFLDYIGLPADRAAEWGWTDAVHPEELEELAGTWRRIRDSGAQGETEVRLRRHDGSYRWFLFRANPLRDDTGRIVKWYGVNTDIEDRKRVEAELKRAYDGFADAQRLSRTGSFMTDLVGDRHTWSDETYRIFEFEPGTRVTVERVRAVIHPDDLPSFEAAIARGVSGVDVGFAFRILTAAGTVKHVRGLAHVGERIEGRPMFVGALQDVTDAMAAEEALGRARSELAHVARVAALSTLTASIAHEVNQPLAGIITNAGTCLRMLDATPPDVEGARETARRTIRDGNRAADVITRLRALFSRKPFSLEPLDLNEATREVIALSLSELQRHRVVLQTELDEDLPRVTGDRIQLQQVILNLLRNAFDAMSDVRDRPRQLLIRTAREDGERVRVTVRDAGVGVDPQGIDKLFDAFYTTKSGGMGIGLSVSRSIVERHHGRLWAEPNDGPGAAFSFSIPTSPGRGADATARASRP